MLKKFSIFILIIILTLSLLAGCGRKNKAVSSVQAIPVKIAQVERGSLGELFVATGALEANQEVNIIPKVAGRVANVYVKMGDYVTTNQVLVELEKTDTAINLARAEASYKQSKENFDRSQKLYNEEIISPQEFERAQAQFQIDQAAYEQAKNQLSDTQIRAPFSGQIGYCTATKGQLVGQTASILSVVDLSTVFVTINLSDSYISQAKIGQSAKITFSSFPDQSFRGKITQLSPAADKATKTFPVKIALNNSSRQFRAGMLAQATLTFNERNNALMIPAEAIIDEVGTKAVYTVTDNVAHRNIVTLGVSDGKMVEILSGLNEKDSVVVLGQNNLEDGSKVVVK